MEKINDMRQKIFLKNILFIRMFFALIIFFLFYFSNFFGGLIMTGILPRFFGLCLFLYELYNTFITISNQDFEKYAIKPKFKNIFTNRLNAIILLFIIIIFLIPIYSPYVIKIISKNNEDDVKLLTDEITYGCENSKEKSKILYDWFLLDNNNMHNTYNKKYLLFKLYPIHIYTTKPFVCIRIIGHKNPLFIFTSRCGACAEYSLFYRELGKTANLTVRSVHNPGEDHNWDEVLIDNEWLIVDPGWPKYNVTPEFYEVNRKLNVSYVYAEYPNNTKIDVTHRYTKLANITIITKDNIGNLLSDVDINILSNNYKYEIDTKFKTKTDDEGKNNILFGGGEYSIVAFKKDGIILYNKINAKFTEDKNQTIEIILNRNMLQNINFLLNNYIFKIFLLLIYALLLWVSISMYMSFVKLRVI